MATPIPVTEPKALFDLEPGTYAALVTSVEDAEGTFGSQIKLTFKLDDEVDEDGQPIELWGWASAKANARTKLFRWATVLLGAAPAVGQPLDVNTLIGRACRLQVGTVDTDQGPRVRVSDVLSPSKRKAAPSPEEAAGAALVGATCSECLDDVSYFDTEGVAFCVGHGPLAGKAGA